MDAWFGFQAVRDLPGLPSEILMVPLGGHTVGHAGVAIDTGDGWLLHAGDAFYHGTTIDAENPRTPLFRQAYSGFNTAARGPYRENQIRLHELLRDRADAVTIVNSHDRALFPAAA
ncbi:hypothetical protein ACFVJ5_30570 [Nocardia sp. NPDC127606]|uniref:hypothetical protein n=1 Tax=Nocardia sp. NPDC127606 TaxID=3345406 RepID=UPI0036327D82